MAYHDAQSGRYDAMRAHHADGMAKVYFAIMPILAATRYYFIS